MRSEIELNGRRIKQYYETNEVISRKYHKLPWVIRIQTLQNGTLFKR